jgi:triosephosphate isomerase
MGVSHVSIGAQDCHAERAGAFTGGVSADMILDAGARWVIVGHSECRQTLDHDNSRIAAKVRAAQRAGLDVILCVGEPGGFDTRTGTAFIVGQLIASLPAEVDPQRLVIAYEPVWAIGSGRTPTARQIDAALSALGAALRDRFGMAGAAIRLLYGGSVNPKNAGDILSSRRVGGLLVGGASLSADAFIPIISAAMRA